VSKPCQILVIDDEESDVILLRHALSRAGLSHVLIAMQDGREAIDYLSRKASGSDGHLPALLLLDLKMPRMTGFDVLIWLRGQPNLKGLPAVVMTSSADEGDRQRAQDLGAADYLVKPDSLPGLVSAWRELHGRWLDQKL
jgi:CheY-like chemotaxis protein